MMISCEDKMPELNLGVPTMGEVEVTDNGSLVFEVKGSLTSYENLVSECGFYVAEDASMSEAEKHPCKLTGKTFATTLFLEGYSRKYYICSYISNGRDERLSEKTTVSIGALADYVSFGRPKFLSIDDSGTAHFDIPLNVAEGVNISSLSISYGKTPEYSSVWTEVAIPYVKGQNISFGFPNVSQDESVYCRFAFTEGDFADVSSVLTAFCGIQAPLVTTAEIVLSSALSATGGGTVLYDGGSPVTQRGVVWSTSPNPTVSLSTKTNDGTGGGSFSSLITGLSSLTKYYVRAYATNAVGTSYGNEVTFTTENIFAEAKDLSGAASANCYIVSERGIYKFRTVKGNRRTSVGNVSTCEVLWESFGTATTPSIGDLIMSVTYKDGYIGFETASTFREGNALIAAKDASGTILWSWHIWLTDQPKGQTYNNGAGVMMDRNLGATSSTPGDVGALGLLYQWGRKDPFLGSSSISDDIEAKSTITWPSPSPGRETIAYATAHPTTFITMFGYIGDWYDSTDDSTDNTRWQSSKTVYDPCPAGWRVPDGGTSGVWSKAFGTSSYWTTSSNWDSVNKGMDFFKTDKKLGSSRPIWYPASGFRWGSNGSLDGVGGGGRYWSVSPDGNYAYYLYFSYRGHVDPVDSSDRADGQSVRCLQE